MSETVLQVRTRQDAETMKPQRRKPQTGREQRSFAPGGGASTGAGAWIALGLAILLTASARAATEPHVDSVLVRSQANGGRAFEQPLGVAVDVSAGEIVVANSGLGRVEFFGRDGRPHGFFVHRITDPAGSERDGMPRQLAVDSRGRLLISDGFAAYVDACDFRGRSLQRITLPAPDDRIAEGSGPGAIAVAADGRFLVATRGSQGRIHVFGADGRWQSTWGEPGEFEGQLSAIAGIAAMPGGETAVLCASTKFAVQVFDATGRYLRGFGIHDIGPGRFSRPTGLTVTTDGRIWVCDAIRQNVQVFDSAGTLLGSLGGGEGPGELFYPSALASDGKGLLALVETGGRRLRVMWVR